jgi:hypothetical protein
MSLSLELVKMGVVNDRQHFSLPVQPYEERDRECLQRESLK